MSIVENRESIANIMVTSKLCKLSFKNQDYLVVQQVDAAIMPSLNKQAGAMIVSDDPHKNYY